MSAQNTTTHNVEVTDNGSTANVIKNIESLITALKAAQTQATSTMSAASRSGGQTTGGGSQTPMPGGTTGSRSAASQAMSGSAYGTLRATGAGTGAAARDFAKESQGLGGLVRLYATYAANVFAVSAAFGALSRAMDTTNMIRSMDQLGASVGKNLGTVSKNIVELTGGAISLQESMQAVAKTSAAGIVNKDIERLAVVAKNASLSLGISLPDAMNRLSRGVTKLEPELLDELGLFTKIGPATEAYARSVGKSVTALTDFERRQAFANAVLKEGEDKFSALGNAVDVNPYSKLVASLQNLAQTGLELVNKVLGPIINLLSENPAALTAAISAIGIALIKQALPAFGQFKEGLRSAANDAKDLAIQKADEARQARKKIERLATKDFEEEADKALAAVVAQEKKIEDLRKKGQFDPAGATAQALAKDTADVKGPDFKAMEAERRKYLIAGNAQAAEAVKGTMESFKAYQTLEEQVTKVRMAEQDRTKELEKSNTRLAANIEAARVAQDNYTKGTIVSSAATNQGLIGMTGAWELLKRDIDDSNLQLSNFEKASLKTRGGVAILTSAVVDLAEAIGGIINRVIAVIAVYEILDAVFSSNAKQMGKFTSALDAAEDSVDNTNRTLALLFGTMSGNVNSIEGISALANAFREVSRSADEAAAAAQQAKFSIQTGNTWDQLTNWAKGFWGGDVDSKLADSLTKQILSSVDIARASGTGDKFEAELKSLLQIKNFNVKEVTEAVAKLGNEGAKPAREKIKEFATEISNSESRLQKFKASLETTTRSYQDYLLSLANQDPLFKLGQNINSLAIDMEGIAQGGFKDFTAALGELAKTPEKLAFFGKEFTETFVDIRTQLQTDSKVLSQYRGQLVQTQKALREFEDLNSNPITGDITKKSEEEQLRLLGSGDYLKYQGLKGQVKVAEENIKIQADKDSFEAAKKLFVVGMDAAFAKGSELIQTALKNGAELNAVKIARASAQFLTGAEKARTETRLNQQELDIRIKTLKSNIDLMLNQDRLIAVIAQNTAAVNLSTVSNNTFATQGEKERAQAELDSAKAFKNILDVKLRPGQIPDFTEQLKSEQDWGAPLSDLAQAMLKRQIGSVAPKYASMAQGAKDLEASKSAEAIAGKGREVQGKAEDKTKILAAEAGVKQALKDQVVLRESILGFTDQTLVKQENQYQQELLTNNQAKELVNAEAALQTAIISKGVETIANARENLRLVKARQLVEQDTKAMQDRQKLLQFELESISRRYELNKADLDLDMARTQTMYTTNSARLNAYVKLSGVSEELLANEAALLELNRADQESAEKILAIENDRVKKVDELNAKISAAGGDPTGEATARLNEITTLADKAKQRIKIETDGRKDIINLNKQIGLVEAQNAKAARQYELDQAKAQTEFIRQRAVIEKSRAETAFISNIGGAAVSNITGITAKNLEDQQRELELKDAKRKLDADDIKRNTEWGEKEKVLIQSRTTAQQYLNTLDSIGTSLTKEQAAAKTDAAKVIETSTKLLADGTKELARQNGLSEEQYNQLVAQNKLKERQSELDRLSVGYAEKIRKINIQAATASAMRELRSTRRTGALEVQQTAIDIYAQNNPSAETYLATLRSINEEETARANTQVQIANIIAQNNVARATAEAQISTLKADPKADPAKVAEAELAINAALQEQINLNSINISIANSQLNTKLQQLAITKEQNLQQAKYNELLRASGDFANSLRDAFGLFGDKVKAVGEGLANMVNTLAESSIRQQNFNKQQEKDQDSLIKAKKELNNLESVGEDDEGSVAAAKKKVADLDKKMADDNKKNSLAELKGDLAAISSTKKMFKEKTAAYKIFAAAEKALALAQIATNAMVLASKLTTEAGTTAAQTAGTASRIPAYITDIWGQTLGKLPFPMGGIVGAGLVALLLSAFGKGGSSKAPPMVTAEMRQETQGTAMGYNVAGEKVQVRRGVFGDETAKSESIDNSLKLIAENSVDGLDYDNKMLNALKGLRDALTESAQALFGVKGLRSGTAFGTVEGANSSGGLFGISSLFGKTTTRNIIDSGIKITGTFSDLAKAGGGVIRSFETVSTTTKSSGFFGIGGSSRTSVGTNFGMLDPKAEAALRNAFDYAGDLLYSIGEKAGKLPAEIERGMAGVKVDELISLRGLTGEDFNKALSNVIGAVLDDATFAIFSEFEKFAKFGEGMLETVVRVVDTNTKVNQAIKNIGTSISGQMQQAFLEVTENSTFFGLITGSYATWKTRTVDIDKLTNDISEALVKAADGLDNFLDKVEGFRSNFLTEAQQLEPIRLAYRKGLTDLGYNADITRDQLRDLIQNFNLFDSSAGRAGKTTEQTYVALLDIADGFDKVADAAEEAAKKVSDEREGLQRKLQELLLSDVELRELDILKIDQTNRALQRQIWAQQDVQTSAKALQSRLADVTKTINSQITSLSDYRQSLTIGDKSNLTQVEQFQEAKQNLTELYRTATDPTAGVDARNTAVGKLQGASDQFLGLARQLYSSGDQYNVAKATVVGILDATKADLENRKTEIQLQLEELESSNRFLTKIEENTKSTNDLIQSYLAAVSVYNIASQQQGARSFAVGTNYVPYNMTAQIHRGERIVPAADNTMLMAGNQEMVVEIRQLNQRIVNLEQAIIEGNMINAAATERNADAIVEAIESSTDTTLQFNRLQKKGMIK
jgi:hypothetical protein